MTEPWLESTGRCPGRQCPAAYLNLLDCCVLSEIWETHSYQDIFPYNGAAYVTFLKQIDTPDCRSYQAVEERAVGSKLICGQGQKVNEVSVWSIF